MQHRSAAINLGGKQQLQLRSLDGPGSHPVMSKQRHKPDSLLKATTPLPKHRNSFKADRRPEPGRSHREKPRSYAIVFLSRKFIRALRRVFGRNRIRCGRPFGFAIVLAFELDAVCAVLGNWFVPQFVCRRVLTNGYPISRRYQPFCLPLLGMPQRYTRGSGSEGLR